MISAVNNVLGLFFNFSFFGCFCFVFVCGFLGCEVVLFFGVYFVVVLLFF